jgi:thioredoxin 1
MMSSTLVIDQYIETFLEWFCFKSLRACLLCMLNMTRVTLWAIICIYVIRTHYSNRVMFISNIIMESQSKSKGVIHVTTDSWDNDVLKSDLPVLVDFWAEWCGPCRMVGPAVEELSHMMNGKIKVTKLNVDENQEIAMRYGIRSIPSLLLFRGGKEIARTVGAAHKESYQKFIEQSLSGA